MIGIRIEAITSEEYDQLAELVQEHVSRHCCTTIGDQIICQSEFVKYKVYIDGWITNGPFNICQKCLDDYKTFGQMTLMCHPLEVLRGKEVSIYPEIESITIRRNEVDDRLRQKELTPKVIVVESGINA